VESFAPIAPSARAASEAKKTKKSLSAFLQVAGIAVKLPVASLQKKIDRRSGNGRHRVLITWRQNVNKC
jgi:hypothetical protein